MSRPRPGIAFETVTYWRGTLRSPALTGELAAVVGLAESARPSGSDEPISIDTDNAGDLRVSVVISRAVSDTLPGTRAVPSPTRSATLPRSASSLPEVDPSQR